MADTPHDDDRDAILARRKRFVARTLGGIEALRGDANERTKRRTKAAVLTVSSLAIACPCLNVAPPDTGEEAGTPNDMPADTTETETGAGTGTGTSSSSKPSHGGMKRVRSAMVSKFARPCSSLIFS